MLEILKNFKDNRRRIYEEAPMESYSKEYYLENCAGHELFTQHEGKELDTIRRYVLDLVPLQPGSSGLDIGCGRGEIVSALSQLGLSFVAGIDASAVAIELSKATCQVQISRGQVGIYQMNATRLEFETGRFDILYMTDIVEHLSDENLRKALSEAHRVLKPGGSLVIHTMPTVNYKVLGQYLVKYYYATKGRPWFTPTAREESGFATHVNIQSKASLCEYLYEAFPKRSTRVFYGPSNPAGPLKRFITALGLWSVLGPHLWAIARKGE